jgi:hypothetical protein
MAGTEMKNAVLIALVVLVILFVVYQYDSSLFGLLGSREGFEDAKVTKGTMANAHGNEKAGQLASPGMPQMNQNANTPSVNAVPPGNPQSAEAFGNDLKTEHALKAKMLHTLSLHLKVFHEKDRNFLSLDNETMPEIR